MASQDIQSCSVCHALKARDGSDLKECGTCGSVRYCGVECQSAHWNDHKIACREIALPPNVEMAGDTLEAVGSHPDGLHLFQGSAFGMSSGEGGVGLMVTAVNIYGKLHNARPVYCVEAIRTHESSGQRTKTHTWYTETKYLSKHGGLWARYDMEPNRDFNIGAGLRDEGGNHMSGGHEFCERDGSVKLPSIHARLT